MHHEALTMSPPYRGRPDDPPAAQRGLVRGRRRPTPRVRGCARCGPTTTQRQGKARRAMCPSPGPPTGARELAPPSRCHGAAQLLAVRGAWLASEAEEVGDRWRGQRARPHRQPAHTCGYTGDRQEMQTPWGVRQRVCAARAGKAHRSGSAASTTESTESKAYHSRGEVVPALPRRSSQRSCLNPASHRPKSHGRAAPSPSTAATAGADSRILPRVPWPRTRPGRRGRPSIKAAAPS